MDKRPNGRVSHSSLDHHPIHHNQARYLLDALRYLNLSKELKMEANVYNEGRALDRPLSNDSEKPSPQKAKAPARRRSAEWLVIVGLLLLSFIPVASGAFRLTQLTGGATVTPANARFFASPLPVTVHIVSASLFAVLGSFQFATGLRRRWPGWHRWAGRLLVVCGLLVGLSGLWMVLFYPHPVGDGLFLSAQRLLFGSAMIVSIVLAYVAIRRGKVTRHRAWMMRGYAIGLGAGTQALVLMVGEMIAGKPNELNRALLMGLAWVINLAVAEWVIRRRLAPRARAASVVVSHLP
jgi:uncharacterized membrane protein